ncbi:MAG: isocitrate/isopropylmalate family dehydrogenase [Ferroplasma sp.]|uniref:isocitrate/isopropylmalate family dehydrogenase n=1 Tax=Ferroplasma sp. TaxID=2591003 RepID=UPI00281524E9|nr:isocitrate/isopropylmalate family dehydrogenase [Ferroplasma sp.]WMT51568.1 MAG: isocitrate/isopropylmalate family dehydrogenase [Ferroplasma sp.]
MVDIAVIPGDGIGKEIIPQVCRMLHSVDQSLNFVYYDISSERYINRGITVTDNEIEEFKSYKSIFFGAIGDFRVKPGVMEQNVILKLRKDLDLYMNIRPAISFKRITGNEINITILRENTEDFYSGISGTLPGKQTFEMGKGICNYNVDISGDSDSAIFYTMGILSERNLTRFFKKAYEIAGSDNITVTDKANAVQMYSIWRDIARRQSEIYNKEIKFEYADSLAYNIIKNPLKYKYIIAPNLYGDIISDMTSSLAGGLGYAPSGNIGDKNSMFEPVHGSAPDIAGRNIANPVASILSSIMMLKHIGMDDTASVIEKSLKNIINKGIIPMESGGSYTTSRFIEEVTKISQLPKNEI